MRAFWVLALYLTTVFAAPTNLPPSPYTGNLWNFHSSVLDEFESNLRRMRDEFEQLEKNLESHFNIPNTEDVGSIGFAGVFGNNGTSIFDLDPSKVKNESFSDTKIVDGKVVHTEEQVIANKNSVVRFHKVEITPKDAPVPVPPTGSDKPKKTFDTPESPSSAPEMTTSKNDVDSVHLDNDENNFDRSKDAEEIESVRFAGGSSHSKSRTREPEKQLVFV